MVQSVKIVKHIERRLENAFVGGSYMPITASCTVLRVRHRFLFWTWTGYKVEKYIPYVKHPFYDGEFSTNRRLGVLAGELESEAGRVIAQDRNSTEGRQS